VSRDVVPVFSGGTGRSGTTVVGKLLSKHPDVRGGKPYEIRFINDRFGLLDLCYGIETFERPWKRIGASFYLNFISPQKRSLFLNEFESRMRGKWWERKNRINNDSGLFRSLTVDDRDQILATFRKQFPRDHIQASRNFLFDFLERQRHNNGEKMWIDTTPLNISVADRIYLLLPNARFIHMKRDGRDTVASVLKETWGPDNPLKALRWWEKRMRISRDALAAIPKAQVLELDLEALVVTDRENSYRKLFEFLGIEDSKETRRYFNEEMPAERVRIGKYRNEITEWKRLDQEYEKALARLKD
jgi:hypothetical protein